MNKIRFSFSLGVFLLIICRNVSDKVLIKEESKQIEEASISEEIKNFEEDLNKYKLAKSNGGSLNKMNNINNNKQNGFSLINQNYAANFYSTTNKKVKSKNFIIPNSESSKSDISFNKKFSNSKTNMNNLKISNEGSSSDLKAIKKNK